MSHLVHNVLLIMSIFKFTEVNTPPGALFALPVTHGHLMLRNANGVWFIITHCPLEDFSIVGLGICVVVCEVSWLILYSYLITLVLDMTKLFREMVIPGFWGV